MKKKKFFLKIFKIIPFLGMLKPLFEEHLFFHLLVLVSLIKEIMLNLNFQWWIMFSFIYLFNQVFFVFTFFEINSKITNEFKFLLKNYKWLFTLLGYPPLQYTGLFSSSQIHSNHFHSLVPDNLYLCFCRFNF